MTNRRKKIAVVALIAFCWSIHVSGYAQTNPETRAASMLFTQFETVAYARADFLSSFDTDDKEKNVDSIANLRLPFGEFVAGLKALGPNVESDLDMRYSAVLVGAKDFGGEDGLGMGMDGLGLINSRKCYIAVLKDGVQPDIDHHFSKSSSESIAGKSVWTWSVPQFEGTPKSTKFYAAQIGSSYFVMANDRPDFEKAVKLLTSTEDSLAASVSIPGWETFSAYKYWINRQFRRSGVYSLDAAGLADLTPDVSSLTFFANVDKRESYIQVRSSDTSMKKIPNLVRGFDQNRLQPQGEGIWQAKIPLSKEETGTDTLFHVFYRFGFGMAL